MAASKQLKTVKVILDWKSCEKFQPDGFKIGSKDGILNSLKKQVIGSLFIVFQTKENKSYRIFDGHSRFDVMSDNSNLFAEKYEMELIQFSDDKQAAEALIQYQAGKLKIDRTEFEEFIEVYELESADELIEEYDLVVIDDGDDESESNDNDDYSGGDDNQGKEGAFPLAISLNKVQYETWKAFKRQQQLRNDTEAFLNLMENI